jgi:transposase InsO family protein
MPWMEASVVNQRLECVHAMLRGDTPIAQLARDANVSRKTLYKWCERFHAGGEPALIDRSRARTSHDDAIADATRDAIIAERKRHPTWGIRKILARLEQTQPQLSLCSAASGQRILGRAGLVVPRPKSRKLPRDGTPGQRVQAAACNDIWAMDFKGDFRMGDGRRCYPGTCHDEFSRFVLGVQGMSSLAGCDAMRHTCEALFERFGMPGTIRTDNGNPFASCGLCGLTKLSVWWLSLGISLDRITPGHPGENGRLERMHRTLKAQTTRPPGANLREQQRLFESFVYEYNHERPHEGLGLHTPASLYTSSPRAYVPTTPRDDDACYAGHDERRSVRGDGTIRLRSEFVPISAALSGRVLGLEAIDDDVWLVRFRKVRLCVLDAREKSKITRHTIPRGGYVDAGQSLGRGDEPPLPFQTNPTTPFPPGEATKDVR